MHQGKPSTASAKTPPSEAKVVFYQPLVSVIIPAYNAELFIGRTLASVLNQTYRHLEVIVIDDGSTDQTASIVRQFASEDSRLVLHHQENAGVAAARNHGIEASSGELIAPIDADDLWHKTNVEKQVQLFFGAGDRLGMAYVWSADIDEADNFTGHIRTPPYYGNIYPALLYANVIGSGSACIIRRSCLDIIGGFSPELLAQDAQGCEDWDLYLRIARRYQVGIVPEVLVGYRRAASSMSTHSARMEKSRQLAFSSVEARFPMVYQKVNRWAASLNYRYACRKALNAGQRSQAQHDLRQAIAIDPLMSLTSYDTWALLLLLAKQSLSAAPVSDHSTAPKRNPARTEPYRIPAGRIPAGQPKQKNRFALKSRLRLWLSPLFPQKLIQRLRLRWLTAQVCADRPQPQMLPAFLGDRVRVKYRLRSQPGYSYLDYASEECL